MRPAGSGSGAGNGKFIFSGDDSGANAWGIQVHRLIWILLVVAFLFGSPYAAMMLFSAWGRGTRS